MQLNRDYEKRDKIIFGAYEPTEYSGGVRRFQRLSFDKVKELVDNNFIDFDDAQSIEFHAEARSVELFSEETENIIEIIIDSYFASEPKKRLRFARRNGGAWEIVYNKGKGFGRFISKKKIAEESQKLKHWGRK